MNSDKKDKQAAEGVVLGAKKQQSDDANGMPLGGGKPAEGQGIPMGGGKRPKGAMPVSGGKPPEAGEGQAPAIGGKKPEGMVAAAGGMPAGGQAPPPDFEIPPDMEIVDSMPATDADLQEKPKLSVVFRLGWDLIQHCKGASAFYLAVSLISTAILVSTPQVFGQLLNRINAAGQPALPGAAAPDHDPLLPIYGFWFLLSVGAIAVALGLELVKEKMDGRMSTALRDRLFGKILSQSPEFFHKNETGRLNMILNQMSIETQMTLRQMVLDPVLQLISLGLSLGLILYNFVQLQSGGGGGPWVWVGLGVVILLAFLSPYLVSKMGNRLQADSSNLRDQNLAVASLVNSSLKSPEEVQAFRAENLFVEKHRKALDTIVQARVKQAFTVESINSLNTLPSLLVQTLLIGFAVFMVLQSGGTGGTGDVGAVVAILLLAPQLMSPLQAISSYLVMLRSAWPSIETVSDVLDEATRTPEAPNARTVDPIEPTLEARNVTFRYRPDLPPVFDDISVTFPTARITGLVAKMGQGKTTFFRLGLRFYDPEAGQVLVGGHPVNDLTISCLRQHVVMMSQFPACFHDTLRDNFRIAKPSASDEEIRALAEKTGIWSILQEKVGTQFEKATMPNVLDRQFGGGKMLSGGQTKLFALTRCLLRKPAVLFLDEPTAGMDNNEKFNLIPLLRQAVAGRTVIVVDHDIRWLNEFCDGFVVLDNAKIVQQGTGRELLEQDGLFRHLYRVDPP